MLSFLDDTVGHVIVVTIGVVAMCGGGVRTTRPIAGRATSDPVELEPGRTPA